MSQLHYKALTPLLLICLDPGEGLVSPQGNCPRRARELGWWPVGLPGSSLGWPLSPGKFATVPLQTRPVFGLAWEPQVAPVTLTQL